MMHECKKNGEDHSIWKYSNEKWYHPDFHLQLLKQQYSFDCGTYIPSNTETLKQYQLYPPFINMQGKRKKRRYTKAYAAKKKSEEEAKVLYNQHFIPDSEESTDDDCNDNFNIDDLLDTSNKKKNIIPVSKPQLLL